VLVATGFGKWGLSNGSAAAWMLADRIAGQTIPWAPVFDAARLKPGTSIHMVAGEVADIAGRFVATGSPRCGRTIRRPRPGRGGGRAVDGNNVAAYRDDAGSLHRVSATCTHLGWPGGVESGGANVGLPVPRIALQAGRTIIVGPATADLADASG